MPSFRCRNAVTVPLRVLALEARAVSERVWCLHRALRRVAGRAVRRDGMSGAAVSGILS